MVLVLTDLNREVVRLDLPELDFNREFIKLFLVPVALSNIEVLKMRARLDFNIVFKLCFLELLALSQLEL